MTPHPSGPEESAPRGSQAQLPRRSILRAFAEAALCASLGVAVGFAALWILQNTAFPHVVPLLKISLPVVEKAFGQLGEPGVVAFVTTLRSAPIAAFLGMACGLALPHVFYKRLFCYGILAWPIGVQLAFAALLWRLELNSGGAPSFLQQQRGHWVIVHAVLYGLLFIFLWVSYRWVSRARVHQPAGGKTA